MFFGRAPQRGGWFGRAEEAAREWDISPPDRPPTLRSTDTPPPQAGLDLVDPGAWAAEFELVATGSACALTLRIEVPPVDQVTAAFTALGQAPPPGSRWRTPGGEVCTAVGAVVAEDTLTPSVVYADPAGRLWVRPLSAFLAGEFHPAPPL